jgi:hypothetical protein
VIAFDEYHQGRGITENAFASLFCRHAGAGPRRTDSSFGVTVLWTNARRFGRPLPLPQVDRRSSLEFVASMAELQERSRAFDLAIENIYTRTRRVLARYAGLTTTARARRSPHVSQRVRRSTQKLETLMRQCEEAINGAPINWRQSIDLVRRLRESKEISACACVRETCDKQQKTFDRSFDLCTLNLVLSTKEQKPQKKNMPETVSSTVEHIRNELGK